MISDGDRFRIAVALSALKFKPADQSFSSYVLDLRSNFPSSSSEEASVSRDLWRKFALDIERDYSLLKQKYDSQQIKLLSLENTVSAVPSSSAEQHIPPASKKKPKKKHALHSATERELGSLPARVDLKLVLEDLSASTRLKVPGIAGPHSLFPVLDDFTQLTLLPEPNLDLLLSITLRIIQLCARLVDDILSLAIADVPTDPKTLQNVGLILYHIISVAFPMLTPQTLEPVIALLDKTTVVLISLIHAFAPRSDAYLVALFLPHPGGTVGVSGRPVKPPVGQLVDIRTDMLFLFKTVFYCLDIELESTPKLAKPSLVSQTLRAALGLEALRELGQLWTVTTSASSSPSSGPDAELDNSEHGIVKKLARKDALWYLCAILYVLFEKKSTSKTSSRGQPLKLAKDSDSDIRQMQESLLEKSVSETLLKLVTRCRDPSMRYVLRRQYHHRNGQGVAGDATIESSSDTLSSTAGVAPEAPTGTAHDGRGQEVADVVDGGVDGDTSTRYRGARHESADVVVDANVDVDIDDDNAGGRLGENCGSDEQRIDGLCEEGIFELDEAEYGMLLSVLERYWDWSSSHDLSNYC